MDGKYKTYENSIQNYNCPLRFNKEKRNLSYK